MTSIRDPNTPAWQQIEDTVDHIFKHPRMFSDTAEGLEALLDSYIDCWTMTRLPTRQLAKQLRARLTQERKTRRQGNTLWFHVIRTIDGRTLRITNQTAEERKYSERVVLDVYSEIWKELKASVPPLVQLAEASLA